MEMFPHNVLEIFPHNMLKILTLNPTKLHSSSQVFEKLP